MVEIPDHPAYRRLKALKEAGVVVEYVILRSGGGKHDLSEHRLAADMAMSRICERWEEWVAVSMRNNPKYQYNQYAHYTWDVSLASAAPYPAEKLLTRPEDPYYLTKPKVITRAISHTQDAEYAYAFLEPPYGNKFVVKDWEALNTLIFSAPANLEAYRWSDNWSNYFDDGKEWWGTFFWTIYDRGRDYFVVVAASNTD